MDLIGNREEQYNVSASLFSWVCCSLLARKTLSLSLSLSLHIYIYIYRPKVFHSTDPRDPKKALFEVFFLKNCSAFVKKLKINRQESSIWSFIFGGIAHHLSKNDNKNKNQINNKALFGVFSLEGLLNNWAK